MEVGQHTSWNASIDVQSFDRLWGPMKLAVDEQAALHITPEATDSGTMHLVNPSGLSTAGTFSGPCPWAESCPPGMAEILSHWASLVENGTWAVAPDAVAENHDWFDSHLGEARLDWDDQLE